MAMVLAEASSLGARPPPNLPQAVSPRTSLGQLASLQISGSGECLDLFILVSDQEEVGRKRKELWRTF